MICLGDVRNWLKPIEQCLMVIYIVIELIDAFFIYSANFRPDARITGSTGALTREGPTVQLGEQKLVL
jgi:hypothetical protein